MSDDFAEKSSISPRRRKDVKSAEIFLWKILNLCALYGFFGKVIFCLKTSLYDAALFPVPNGGLLPALLSNWGHQPSYHVKTG